MSPANEPGSHTRAKSTVALLLSFAAGLVDVVGYLTVYRFFTANMTGNTVHLGNNAVSGNWRDAAIAGSIIASFVMASIVGRAIIEAAARNSVRSIASVGFIVEAALIAAFIWMRPAALGTPHAQPLPTATVCGLLALLAGAMGLQTATLTRIGPLTIHTTFVTGMLNKFGEAVSHWLFWLHDAWRREMHTSDALRQSLQTLAFREARFVLTIWTCYLAGAIAGTWMNAHWKMHALYISIMLLAIAVLVDQFRPLSLEEEVEQLKGAA